MISGVISGITTVTKGTSNPTYDRGPFGWEDGQRQGLVLRGATCPERVEAPTTMQPLGFRV